MSASDEDSDDGEIEVLRARIEELDARVIRLLGERFAHVRRLGRRKALADVPVENPQREAELCALYVQAALHEGLAPDFVLRLFAVVHEHSKREQGARDCRPRPA